MKKFNVYIIIDPFTYSRERPRIGEVFTAHARGESVG